MSTPGLPDQPYADLANTPDPVPTAPPRWVVEIWVDRAWYAAQGSSDPLPAPGPPVAVVVNARSALIGRASAGRTVHPEIDCADDSGVSRRHAQLSTDGSRWSVEDLESANGTFIGPASGDLPQDPLPAGRPRELGPGDQVYLGAWTRLVVHPPAEDELD